VQKLASEAVDTVRRQQVGLQGETAEGRALKKSRWALLKNPWNLTQRQGEKLSEVARTNQRLYRAYLLKESLARGLYSALQGGHPRLCLHRLEQRRGGRA
jgi:transposase